MRKKVIVNTDELNLVIPSKGDIIKFNDEKEFPNCIDNKLHKWRMLNGFDAKENEEFSKNDLIIETKVMCENCKLEGIGSFRLYMVIEEIDEQ